MQAVVEYQPPVGHLFTEVVQFVAVAAQQFGQFDVVRGGQHDVRPAVEARQHGFPGRDTFGGVRALEQFVEHEEARRGPVRVFEQPLDGEHLLQIVARPFGYVVRNADRRVEPHVGRREPLRKTGAEGLAQQGVEHHRPDEGGFARHVRPGEQQPRAVERQGVRCAALDQRMHDLHGFEVFAVGERRAAGLRGAAQAHDRDGRVGPADEAEHVVDGVAVSRDAAGEAVEKNHLDVERDLHQLECQPSDGRQFVASVALRADDAAAVLDLGDPADRPCGFVRAGNPLCRKVPRGFQGRGKLLYGRCVEGDVDFVAVMNIHVDRVDRHEEQQQRRIKRREKQRGRGRSGQRVDQSDAADPDRGVEDQPAEVVGVVAREACKVSGAPLRQLVVVFESTDPAVEIRGILLAPQRPQPGVEVLLADT